MNTEDLSPAYNAFFEKNEAGKYFVNEILIRKIADYHKQSEKQPESARDLSQRAAGIRDVLEHIQSVQTPVKKGGTTE